MAVANRYSSGIFVSPPSPAYPGVDFWGSTPATVGNTQTPGRGGGPQAGVNAVLPPYLAAHHAIAIATVVAVGFAIYWWASRE